MPIFVVTLMLSLFSFMPAMAACLNDLSPKEAMTGEIEHNGVHMGTDGMVRDTCIRTHELSQ